ncbi:hypothetical protein Psal005_01290 [Piscirickettsia salmonis]|nr:hypothetical protein Psal005_01290 [Piscirickettsia salmonis]
MKNIDFKKSFSFVLAFINEIKYKPIEKKWEELLLPNGKNDNLEVCSGHKYDFSKCNFASLSELYELRESLILPFFLICIIRLKVVFSMILIQMSRELRLY